MLGGLLSNAAAFLESYAALTNDAAIDELAKLISNVDMILLNDPNTQTEFVNRQKVGNIFRLSFLFFFHLLKFILLIVLLDRSIVIFC